MSIIKKLNAIASAVKGSKSLDDVLREKEAARAARHPDEEQADYNRAEESLEEARFREPADEEARQAKIAKQKALGKKK